MVVDATVVGQIPINETANNFQEVLLYSFVVPLSLINGSESVSVDSDFGDGFIVNFSELRIEAVPEPSTALLLASGVIGLAIHGRRRRA